MEKKKFDVKRYISAIVGFPIVALILISGNKLVIDITMTIVALISMYEYLHVVSKEVKPVKWLAYLSCFIIAFIHLIPKQYLSTIGFLAVPVALLVLFFQVIVTNMKTNFKDVSYTLFGMCYVVFLIMSIALVRGLNRGEILIWFMIITAWGTDTCAYLVGYYFGKHKFSKVSPKKSIEGCTAGTIGAVIICCIFAYFTNTYMGMTISYIKLAAVAFVLSIIGQIGDFAASSIKRALEEKDFGNLIPGHGGMLDRIDSLMFIAPFAYILLTLI